MPKKPPPPISRKKPAPKQSIAGMNQKQRAQKAADMVAKKATPSKSYSPSRVPKGKGKPVAKAVSGSGLIGKSGGRMVGGYSAKSGKPSRPNPRVAKTSWSKAGGARQNQKKQLPKSL